MLKTWKLNLKQISILLPKRDLVIWSFFAALPFLFLIFSPGSFEGFERALLDFKARIDQKFFHTGKETELIILGIDSRSLEKSPYKWPWPSSYWAQLLERIDSRYQPAAFLIDIYFQADQQNVESVEVLAAEMKRNKKTGLVGIFEESLGIAGTELKVFPPIKALRESAAYWGISQQPIDSDGTVRTFVLSDYRLDKKHISYEFLKFTGNLPDISLPALKKVSTIFRFKARENSSEIFSLQDAIDGNISREQLLNRKLLIGPNAPILHDYHKTPVGVLTGPELVANSINTLNSARFQVLYESFWLQLFFVIAGIVVALICFTDQLGGNLSVVLLVGAVFFCLLLSSSFLVGIHLPIASSLLSYVIFAAINLIIFRFNQIALVRNSLHEAEVCGKIQQNFFPAQGLKTKTGIEIEGFCQPFQYAGGDYFDFFELPDGNVFFFLGDVSGHGISASMTTTAAKSIVSIHREKGEISITELFDDINMAIRHFSDRRIMMSAVSGLILPQEKKIRLYSAGHLPAYLAQKGAVKEFPIPGMPLGASKRKHRCGFTEFDLPQNGQLILYSDGVIEAVNWQNQLFSFENFRKLLGEKIEPTPMGTIEVIFSALRKHTEERSFQDDVTILVINFVDCEN
jgi:serine phosphatase RsbU (regulator of sigma subunit)/CHASE2 domain-containing sensor protein